MPAVSPTVWVPVLTVTARRSCRRRRRWRLLAVAPSICRLNLPGSVAGLRSLTTSIVPVLRVLVIVQTTSSPLSTATFSEARRRSPGGAVVVRS